MNKEEQKDLVANSKVSEQDTMHDINKPITLEDLTNPDKKLTLKMMKSFDKERFY